METIKMNCGTCSKVHELTRDKDAPEGATSMGCNWCPGCESEPEDDYQEWYNYSDGTAEPEEDPKQLLMFSIADNILENHQPNTEDIEVQYEPVNY